MIKILKFIDLFSGIGGFRIGMEEAGYKCVFSADIDEHAAATYFKNYGENSLHDITKIDAHDLPDFDILCAGFPCQSFSVSGKRLGFYDQTRGTLFFDILRILREKKPKAFILENVKNLERHDKGRTMNIILSSLEEIGYTVNFDVLNARNFGVPQNRERVIIVGTLKEVYFDFNNLRLKKIDSMEEFLDENIDSEDVLNKDEYTLIDSKFVKRQNQSGLIFIGYRNKKMRTTGVRENTEHLSRVHKQPNRIYSSKGTHPTIPSQEISGRFFIYDHRFDLVRKLSLNECYRFMGFPENFVKYGPKSEQYRRIGNSINPKMVKEIGIELKRILEKDETCMQNSIEEELEKIYSDVISLTLDEISKKYELNESQISDLNYIVEKEETSKGVFTVVLSSLIYKHFHNEQDVRYHQASLENGYSGRTFDTNFVTPFLKRKRFRGAMKESGWLTRSLEQNQPYTSDYTGSIRDKKLKKAFLSIFIYIEEENVLPIKFIYHILKRSLIEKEKQNVSLINPIKVKEELRISDIMNLLEKHFSYNYNSRGASILPVVAFQSVYECLMEEIARYKNKKLDSLASHYSSDKSSGDTGDIVIRNSDNSLFEVVEVKYGIPIDEIMIDDAYNKLKSTTTERYYILSTVEPSLEELHEFEKQIIKIRNEHGVQIVVNGLMKTLNYYLRLLDNTDEFLKRYVKNIENNPEVNYEHKISWNNINNKS